MAGACQHVQAEVTPAFDPVVVLLGQDGADQADQGVASGEDTDHVGPPADLSIEALLGIVGPDLSPDFLGERGERQDVSPVVLQVGNDLGQLLD